MDRAEQQLPQPCSSESRFVLWQACWNFSRAFFCACFFGAGVILTSWPQPVMADTHASSISSPSHLPLLTMSLWLLLAGLLLTTVTLRWSRVRNRRATHGRLPGEHDLIENLSVVMFELLLKPAGALVFKSVHGNVGALFGVSAQAMMENKNNVMAWVLPEDRMPLLAAIMASTEHMQAVRVMFRVNNGSQVLWLSGQLMPRREPNGAIIWHGYWSDITDERKQTSDAVHEAASAAARAKDEFLAMMSHEIRTPMNGVMGLVEVLEGTPLNNDQAGLVAMMRGSAGTMLAILDDLLDYAKIEAGHLALNYTAVDLRQLCDQALGLLSAKAHEKRLHLCMHIDAALAAKHSVDGTRLRQILFNLLSNSIKFTPHGSVMLRIDVEQDEVHQQQVCIKVEDSGKGISKEQLSRLFEPFVQADSSISRRFGGTGLGLSICRRLVTRMDGEINIESVENAGTTAQLKLTLAVMQRDCSHAALRGRSARLLLKDRNIGQAAMMYLTALGMTVVNEGAADLKIAGSVQVEKIELIAPGVDGRPASILQLNANPLHWGTFRQACLMSLESDVRDVLGVETVSPEPPRRRSERILVAEDNLTNQEVIRRFLHRLNFECNVVSNGLEAFEALKNDTYALLLTDCHMPGMDGFTLVRYVREIETQQALVRLPVVGITASTRAEDEEAAAHSGMDVCLVKPTSLTMLSDCLEKLLPLTSENDVASAAQARTSAFGKFELPGAEPISSLQIKRLEEELGEEGKMTVLRIFRDTLKQDLEGMPKYGDDELISWLHRVKGAIAVMQFDSLLKVIDELSATLEENQGRATAQAHARLRGVFRALCQMTIEQIDKLLPLEQRK